MSDQVPEVSWVDYVLVVLIIAAMAALYLAIRYDLLK